MPSLGTPIAVGRTAEIYAWENNCVVKLIKAGFPAVLADQEWFKADAAWKMGAPAARPVELIEVEGRRGVVFEHIQGPTMVQGIEHALWRLDHFAQILGRTHAELHRLSAAAFPSYHERVGWALTQPNLLSEARKIAIWELSQRLPDAETLCHADFHPQNILLTAAGPRIIDWEGSVHGEADADVANTCLWIHSAFMTESGRRGWVLRQIGQRFEKVYLATYQSTHGPVKHVNEWMAIHAACLMDEEHRDKLKFHEQIVRGAIPDW